MVFVGWVKGVEAEHVFTESVISCTVLLALKALVSVSQKQDFVLRRSGLWDWSRRNMRNPQKIVPECKRSALLVTRKLKKNGFCRLLHRNNNQFMKFWY